MILTEYDEQQVMNGFYEDGREEGISLGIQRGRDEGISLGIERGREEGICALIADNQEEGISKERILEKLKLRFELTQEKAEEYFCKFGG